MDKTSDQQREKVLLASVMAAASNPGWLTSDRVEALAGGHGMLNIPVVAVCNVIATELRRGVSPEVKFADAVHQPIDDLLAKAIQVAKDGGADGANAALIAAAILYLAGANAQVGIPAGNRKLGSSARMIAGVSRSGLAAVPTAKMNNKISGFAAVSAVYDAMIKGELSPIQGRDIPEGVGGGVMVGHGALGEDFIFPGMAEKGAAVGTKAMMDAMSGAGMPSQKFLSALFGAAAILEIIHPDADVREEYGPYGKVTSAYVAGMSAVRTAGLPEKLHVRITGKEVDTAKLIGDLGLILKDIGGPTVIGVMALDEIVSIFEEGLAGAGAGPVNPPLGHVCGDAVIALLCLLEDGSTEQGVAKALRERRQATSFDPDTAMIAMNIIGRKATQVCNGPVTNAMILSSTPVLTRVLYDRACRTYDDLSAGKSLGDIVRELDHERQLLVERRGAEALTKAKGKTVKVHFTKIAKGARRSSKMAARWLAFDPALDAEVTLGDETIHMEGIINRVVPEVAQGIGRERAPFLSALAPFASELLLAGNVIINVTVPAVVAAAMGRMSPSDAALEAQSAGIISAGIPGTKAKAEAAALVAVDTLAL
ncbi:hypothetical protein [Paracoccus thiocyanatus]|uniref:Uncharacterized protein n=1 Tax=Paracoccus thiocyanatus TaxID=34006 RepID=A0A3D8PBJ2_9RHOB|nr:hypothetical protein [Paracoccus thiocyanatus]RDW13443.1 hypothetical protein DIE28_08105 [Paracoccus thiocyanatus]